VGRICTVCGVITVAQAPVPALNHDFVEASREEPTETESGFIKFGCTRCGVTMTKVLPATDHNYIEIGSAEATCDKDGYIKYQCSYEDCGEIYTKVIPALGHTYGDWVITKEPSCSEIGMMMSACMRCELAKAQYLAITEHVVVDDEAIEPTCTEIGYTQGSHCVTCGEIFVEQSEIPALGHTEKYIDAVAPTCTESGNETGVICAVCDAVLVEPLKIDALGHEVVNVIIKEATCTTEGLEQDVCVVCTKVIKDNIVIKAKGHKEEVLKPAVNPTCELSGSTQSTICSVCKVVLKNAVVVPAFGHKYIKDESVTYDATCDKDGYYKGVCVNCGDVKEEYIKATGHKEKIIPGCPADCTVPGSTDGKKCITCGAVLVEQTPIYALGHDLICDKSIPATCTEKGVNYFECSRCDYEEMQYVEPVGHSWSKWTEIVAPKCETQGAKRRNCTTCGTVEEETTESLGGHSLVTIPGYDATCTEDGKTTSTYCEKCNTVFEISEVIKPYGHSWSEWKVTVTPACETIGERKRYCSACCEIEIQAIDSLGGHSIVTKLGYDATCTEPGKTNGTVCKTCKTIFSVQEDIAPLGHDLILDRDASLYRCLRCNYTESATSDINLKISNFKLFSYNNINYTFAWDECVGADGYIIAKIDPLTGELITICDDISTCSYTLDLPSGWYRIRAYGEVNGEIVYGDWSEMVFGTGVPYYPRNIEVHSQCNGIALSWNGDDKFADGFEIYQKNENGNYICVIDTDQTSAIVTNLIAGETYELKIRAYANHNNKIYGGFSETIKVTYIPGADHAAITVVKGIGATCTTNGVTDGEICSYCGTIIVPQQSIPATGHVDSDNNALCDSCNCELPKCDCNCHKDGISSIFFKIVLFFQKIFRSNKTCKCGAAHY
jgi:hypothetical protein